MNKSKLRKRKTLLWVKRNDEWNEEFSPDSHPYILVGSVPSETPRETANRLAKTEIQFANEPPLKMVRKYGYIQSHDVSDLVLTAEM